MTLFEVGDRVRCTFHGQENVVRVITAVRNTGYSFRYTAGYNEEYEFKSEDSNDPHFEWWELDRAVTQ